MIDNSRSNISLAMDWPSTGPHVIPHGPPPVAINAFFVPGIRPTIGAASGDTGLMQACSISGLQSAFKRIFVFAILAQAADTRDGSGLFVWPGLGHFVSDLIVAGLSTFDPPQPDTYKDPLGRGSISK